MTWTNREKKNLCMVKFRSGCQVMWCSSYYSFPGIVEEFLSFRHLEVESYVGHRVCNDDVLFSKSPEVAGESYTSFMYLVGSLSFTWSNLPLYYSSFSSNIFVIHYLILWEPTPRLHYRLLFPPWVSFPFNDQCWII